MNNIFDKAEFQECKILKNVSLDKYTTFRIGGIADILIIPPNEKALGSILKECCSRNIKYLIIGNGSNLLISDEPFHGVVIYIGGGFNDIFLEEDGVTLKCGAGVKLSRLSSFAAEKSLTGLEFAHGIPGTAGGAAYMNAGAYGGEMKDVLLSVSHVTDKGEVGTLSGDKLKLSYRHSAYTDNGFVITGITVRLKYGNKDEIKSKIDDLTCRRREKQPIEYASAGSTFKRPEGYYAAALIESCGLKGRRNGGAQVSEKHAGFIINTGNATFDDVCGLIKIVQDTVKEKKGVFLETEVKIIKPDETE